MLTEKEMVEQINGLTVRVVALEQGQITHMIQTKAIKSDTEELLAVFQALQGFWKVLAFIGKLAKPIAAVTTFFGLIYVALGKK
jgi:hypothetical protein